MTATPGQAADDVRQALAAWNIGESGARDRLNEIIADWAAGCLPYGTPPDVAPAIAMTITAGISPYLEAEAIRLSLAATAAGEPHAARADEFARVKVRLCALVAGLDETVKRGVLTDSEFDQGAAHASAVTARQLREILNDTALGTTLGTTPQPAPGLAALREQLAAVLGWFASNGGGHYARISGTLLAREYTRARLPLPGDLKHLAGQ